MALVLYYLDALAQKFRSVGGPDLDPSTPQGLTGFGQSPFGTSSFGDA